MRSRYLISAAVLVAAACIGRRREAPAEPFAAVAPPAPEPPPVPAAPPVAEAVPVPVAVAVQEPAQAVAVEEPAPAEDLAIVEDPAVVAERGRFTLGGQAIAPGHAVVSGITFASRRGTPVAADALRLTVERALNVPDGGLVVLRDAGFAPDPEGFTIALAAAAAGRFAAAGTYELLADPFQATPSASTGGTDR